MNNFPKIKNWIFTNFQLITLGLLFFALVLTLKQQNDLTSLKSQINSINNNVDDISSKLDDFSNKLDEVESNLSSEMDYIRDR